MTFQWIVEYTKKKKRKIVSMTIRQGRLGGKPHKPLGLGKLSWGQPNEKKRKSIVYIEKKIYIYIYYYM